MKRTWLKRILLTGLVALIALAAIVVLRTLTHSSRQITPPAYAPIAFAEDRAVRNLQQAIRIKTVADPNALPMLHEALKQFHSFLQEAFPKVHAAMKRETISEGSLLYTWTGTEPNSKPIILLAHMDVVPGGTQQAWAHPPFSGDLADGFIWGRGTLDDKTGLTGILEAAEALLSQGYRPRRTLYLAFGHDEEIGGVNGAVRIAEMLKSRGVRAEICLDEGMAVLQGIVPGVAGPTAMIGVAEKGYLTLDLSVEGQGGHSSQPPPQTSAGILCAAIARLEAHPFPADLRNPVRQGLETLAPEMPFAKRLVLSNLWLFKKLVVRQMEGDRTTNASLRTTMAVTILGGGTKENVLPTKVWATVNCRLIPGDTIETVVARIRAIIADDRVRIEPKARPNNASPVSDVGSTGYTILNTTIRQVFPNAAVAPALVLGATDSRHFSEVTETTCRFSPLPLTRQDMARIHGANERIGKDDYLRCIRFYGQFIRNMAS